MDKASEWGATYSAEGGSKNSVLPTYYTTLPLLMVIQVVEFGRNPMVCLYLLQMLAHRLLIGLAGILVRKIMKQLGTEEVAMWVAYANSAKLRELFPDGKSIAATPTVNSSDLAKVNSSKIYIAAESRAGGAVIYASVNSKVSKDCYLYCWNKRAVNTAERQV